MYKERERKREREQRQGSYRLSETELAEWEIHNYKKTIGYKKNSYSSWLMMRNVGHLLIIIKSHEIKHTKGIPLIQMYKQTHPLIVSVWYFRNTYILVFTFHLVFLRHLSPFHIKMYYIQNEKKKKKNHLLKKSLLHKIFKSWFRNNAICECSFYLKYSIYAL